MDPLAGASLDHGAAERWPIRTAAHLLGLGLIAVILVALPTAPSDLDRHQLPKEAVFHFFTWAAVLLARPTLPPRGSVALRVGLLGLLGISILASIGATNPWLALRATLLTLSGAAAFVTARHLARRGAGGLLLRWCAVGAAVATGAALAQAYGVDSVLFATTRAPGGTLGNRNFMAHLAALALPVVAWVTVSARRSIPAVIAAVVFAILTAGIVLSRSRTAWIGGGLGVVAMSIALMAVRQPPLFPLVRRRVLLLLGAIPLAIATAILVPNRLDWRSNAPYLDTLTGLTNHREGSGHGRTIQYGNTLRLAGHHPVLGVGPGNWAIRYADVAPPSDPSWAFGDTVPLNPWPSSDWLALLSERGPLAVLAVLLLGAALCWQGVSALSGGGLEAIAGIALLGLVITAAVEGTFDAVLLLPVPVAFTALAAGALSIMAQRGVVAAEPLPTGGGWYRILVALLAIATARSAQQTAAYIIAGSGRSLTRLRWAARVDPTSYPIRIALALRSPCGEARLHAQAAERLAPSWPAPREAAQRCRS